METSTAGDVDASNDIKKRDLQGVLEQIVTLSDQRDSINRSIADLQDLARQRVREGASIGEIEDTVIVFYGEIIPEIVGEALSLKERMVGMSGELVLVVRSVPTRIGEVSIPTHEITLGVLESDPLMVDKLKGICAPRFSKEVRTIGFSPDYTIPHDDPANLFLKSTDAGSMESALCHVRIGTDEIIKWLRLHVGDNKSFTVIHLMALELGRSLPSIQETIGDDGEAIGNNLKASGVTWPFSP